MVCTKIQMAYEALSDDDKRAKYDTIAGFIPLNSSTRAWREPSYGPCPGYTEDPPFWSVELRAMTVQKCARIAKIQHLEREIRELVVNLSELVNAEDRAASKEKRPQAWLFFARARSAKAKAQRQRDFLAKSIFINARLDKAKNELRTAHEEHRKILERDNARKTWWARERVRRVEEENRRAATTAAEAARRRAEKAREHANRDREAAQAAEEIRQQAQEEAVRKAQAAKAEEMARKRAEMAREDPEVVKRREREAQEWLARQREENLESECQEGVAK